MNFKTVKEVTSWQNFVLNGEIYDLSHLNAHWVEYLDKRDETQPISYKFIVTYGLHCFTKKLDDLDDISRMMYNSPNESRPFNIKRYKLSKQLPSIIKSLGDRETLVCHAGYGNFATVKFLEEKDSHVDYFVVFAAFRERKKLRLHIVSAYPRYKGIGRVKKVGFFVIAKKLLHNQKLPKP